MTTSETAGDESARPPTSHAPSDPSPLRGFSLATLMAVVTLVSLLSGLAVVAPGLAVAAVAIMLPAVARTAIILRHTAPAGALSAKLATYGASCCVGVVVAVATAVCGFVACCVVGIPSGFAMEMIASLFSRGDGYGALFVGGISAGIVAACIAATLVAYRMMLLRPWGPVPVESITRSERRLLLGFLLATTIATVVGAILTMRFYA